MPNFLSDGISLSYQVFGDGKPILLIHGFASNVEINWVSTGWVETLTGAGYRVIALDNRGHGRSQKLYDPRLYFAHEMAADAARLLDHLEIERLPVIGYSMGARIAAFLALREPRRVAGRHAESQRRRRRVDVRRGRGALGVVVLRDVVLRDEHRRRDGRRQQRNRQNTGQYPTSHEPKDDSAVFVVS